MPKVTSKSSSASASMVPKKSTAQTSTQACLRCKAKHARCQRESPNAPCKRCSWNKVECEDAEPQMRAPRNLSPPLSSTTMTQPQHTYTPMAYQNDIYAYNAQIPTIYYDMQQTPYYAAQKYAAEHEFYTQQSQLVSPPSSPYQYYNNLPEQPYAYSTQYYPTATPVAAMEGPMARLYQSGQVDASLRDVWGVRSEDIEPKHELLQATWAPSYCVPTPNLSDDGSSYCGSEADYFPEQPSPPLETLQYISQNQVQAWAQRQHEEENVFPLYEMF